jgi:hypothetical protein
VGHISRSSDLLHLKASQLKVFQSDIKTDRGTITSGAYDIIAEVMSR